MNYQKSFEIFQELYVYFYGNPTISYLTIYYLFTSHKFVISNANWWLEAWTDDIENMHIGNERAVYIVIKIAQKIVP